MKLKTIFAALLLSIFAAACGGSGKSYLFVIDTSGSMTYQDNTIAKVKKQMPQLNELEVEIDEITAELKNWEDTLQYPKKITQYRAKGLREVAQLRRANEIGHDHFKDIYAQWFKYNRALMAVYARWGELKILKREDEHLRMFMLEHREIIYKMEGLLKKIEKNYVEADFLLNSKLN